MTHLEFHPASRSESPPREADYLAFSHRDRITKEKENQLLRHMGFAATGHFETKFGM